MGIGIAFCPTFRTDRRATDAALPLDERALRALAAPELRIGLLIWQHLRPVQPESPEAVRVARVGFSSLPGPAERREQMYVSADDPHQDTSP